MRRLLPFLALIVLVPASRAQTAEDSVRAVITRLFDGMRASDSTMVLSVFHPHARLMSVGRNREGQTVVREDAVAAFARSVGTPHPEVYDERLTSVEVRIDGPMATAWTPYQFYVGQNFSHCGVNSFQFARTGGEWKIVHLIDTRRRQGCAP
jgi:ketosteroid isomerase-like protein